MSTDRTTPNDETLRLQALEQDLRLVREELSRSRRLVRRVSGGALALALAGLTVLGHEAWAAGCTPTGAFLYLPGLRYFCADAPAFADEVNANTQGLVSAVVWAIR